MGFSSVRSHDYFRFIKMKLSFFDNFKQYLYHFKPDLSFVLFPDIGCHCKLLCGQDLWKFYKWGEGATHLHHQEVMAEEEGVLQEEEEDAMAEEEIEVMLQPVF